MAQLPSDSEAIQAPQSEEEGSVALAGPTSLPHDDGHPSSSQMDVDGPTEDASQPDAVEQTNESVQERPRLPPQRFKCAS